jgi:hypothetical protein
LFAIFRQLERFNWLQSSQERLLDTRNARKETATLHERMLILTGTEESVIKAMRSFLPAFADRKTNSFHSIGKMRKRLIPENLCSILIGKGGRVIQEINSSTGAVVKVAHPEEGQKDSCER